MPRVSIGLPVYNGDNFLEDAIRSILDQTYTDFELLISDNCSTDGTEAICRRYAEDDPRVRYNRFDVNQGAAVNFNYVFAEARGEYFKWAAHDDVLGPEYLARCVEVLDKDPSINLCHCRTGHIDQDGRVVGTYDFDLRLDSPDTAQRFHDLIVVRHDCITIFGVIRPAVLAKTPLIGKYVGSDRVLLGELALHGRLYELPEVHFYRRSHAATSGGLDERTDRLVWFDPQRRVDISLPNWRILWEYMHAIRRAPLDFREQISCWIQIPQHIQARHRYLTLDITEGMKMLLNRTALGRKVYQMTKRIIKPGATPP